MQGLRSPQNGSICSYSLRSLALSVLVPTAVLAAPVRVRQWVEWSAFYHNVYIHDLAPMGLCLGVDFDGTLVEEGVHPPRWRAGARNGLLALKAAGHQLVLHTGRLTPRHEVEPGPGSRMEADEFWRVGLVPRDQQEHWDRYAEMRDFLMAEGCWGLFDVVWQTAGKPPCDSFIDDRLVDPDWAVVRAQFGVA
jgi:hypothetical protein